jgi:four helix bundle protein
MLSIMATTFESLRVWHEARNLCVRIYALTRAKAFSRDFALSDQIRRAAVSVMSNIAEGCERGGKAEFIRFLAISKGSLAELRCQLYIAEDATYASPSEVSELRRKALVLSRQIDALMTRIKSSSQ